MTKHKTRIYTRRGDDGSTGLADGRRLPKDDVRIEAIGTVDELNARIGLLRTCVSAPDTDRLLEGIQHRLFELGAELATPGAERLHEEHTLSLEAALDALDATLPPLREFILPGGSESSARAHLARTGCRQAERGLLRLSRTEPVNSASVKYLNRLSDLLFVLARVLARRDGGGEIVWRKDL